MSIKTPVTISVIWIIVSPILFFLGFGSGYIFPLNIIVPVIIMPVFPILAWLTYFILLIKNKNNVESQKKYDIISSNNSFSPQEKTNLIESEKNANLFLLSIILSSILVVITIVFAVINGRKILSASRSGVGGMVFLDTIPLYGIIIFLEIVTSIFSIILFSKYKKSQKSGIEPTKKLKTLRKVNIILFIIILCWPICFYIIGIAYHFSNSLI